MTEDEFNTMKHVFLAVISIAALVIILAVVFDCIPLIPIDADEERVKTINAFAVDASLGVLTSILFYYLLVYMGERKRGRDMRKLIQGKLNMVALMMEIIIGYYVDKCNLTVINRRLYGLKKDDFNQIGGLSKTVIEYWFHCPAGTGCTLLSGSTEIGFLKEYTDKVDLFAGQILDSPGFAIEETKLITLVTNIKKCSFVREVSFMYKNQRVPISPQPIGGMLYEFYQLYLRLQDYAKVDEIEIRGNVPTNAIPINYR